MSKINRFIFTVIIPIYNAERFLAETIESVINQTIGFEDNIQIVLVDDGSIDSSAEICSEYINRYPDNIMYVYQNNSGVVAARNRGVEYIEGKYVNFLDSDDLWKTDAFEIVYKFFEKHYDTIDIVACRVKYFGRINHYHYLDYKFNEDLIADIREQHDFTQGMLNSTFIKAESIMLSTCNISIGEDVRYVNEIIFKKGKYGLVRCAEYYYRRDKEQNSAFDKRFKTKDYYIPYLRDMCLYLLNQSIEVYGDIVPYVKFLVARFCLNRAIFVSNKPAILSTYEWKEYLNILQSVIRSIEDKYIIELRNASIAWKASLLEIKNGLNYDKYNLVRQLEVSIHRVSISKNRVHIVGRSRIELLRGTYECYICDDNGKIYEIINRRNRKYDLLDIYGTPVFEGMEFTVELPLKNKVNYWFVYKAVDSDDQLIAKMIINKSVVNDNFRNRTVRNDKWIFKSDNTHFSLVKVRRHFVKEFIKKNARLRIFNY